MTIIVYNPEKGELSTDSFTNVTYGNGSMNQYELHEKTWTSPEKDIKFTVLGAQVWNPNTPALLKEFHKAIDILRRTAWLIQQGDDKVLGELNQVLQDTMVNTFDLKAPHDSRGFTCVTPVKEEAPKPEPSLDVKAYRLLRTISRFVFMTKKVVIVGWNGDLVDVTNTEAFVGTDPYIYYALRRSFDVDSAFARTARVSGSASEPVHRYSREDLQDLVQPVNQDKPVAKDLVVHSTPYGFISPQ